MHITEQYRVLYCKEEERNTHCSTVQSYSHLLKEEQRRTNMHCTLLLLAGSCRRRRRECTLQNSTEILRYLLKEEQRRRNMHCKLLLLAVPGALSLYAPFAGRGTVTVCSFCW